MTAESLSPENDAIVQTLSPEQQKALEENKLSPDDRQKIINMMMRTREGRNFIQDHAFLAASKHAAGNRMDLQKLNEAKDADTIASLQELVTSYRKGLGERFSRLPNLPEEELRARNTVYNKLQKQGIDWRGRETGVGVIGGDEAKQQEVQELLELVATKRNLSDAQKKAIQNLLGGDKKDLIDQAFLDDVTRAEKEVERAQANEAIARGQMEAAKRGGERWKKAKVAEVLGQKQAERALTQTKKFIERNKNQIEEIASGLPDATKFKKLLESFQKPDTATTAQVKRLQQALGTRADGKTPLTVDGSFGPRTYASLEAKVKDSTALASLEKRLPEQTV